MAHHLCTCDDCLGPERLEPQYVEIRLAETFGQVRDDWGISIPLKLLYNPKYDIRGHLIEKIEEYRHSR